jgi:hypothetical protein
MECLVACASKLMATDGNTMLKFDSNTSETLPSFPYKFGKTMNQLAPRK